MVTKIIDLENEPNSLDALLSQLDDNTEILLVRGDIPVAPVGSLTLMAFCWERLHRNSHS